MATYCTHCGEKFEYGAVRYVVTVHVATESDGALPKSGDQEDLEAFMRSVDREDSEEVDKDLQQSKAFVLCSACKNDFLKNVERPNVSATPDEISGGPEEGGGGKVH